MGAIFSGRPRPTKRKALLVSELKNNKVYQCRMSGIKCMLVRMSYVKYYNEQDGCFKTMEVFNGQLVEL